MKITKSINPDDIVRRQCADMWRQRPIYFKEEEEPSFVSLKGVLGTAAVVGVLALGYVTLQGSPLLSTKTYTPQDQQDKRTLLELIQTPENKAADYRVNGSPLLSFNAPKTKEESNADLDRAASAYRQLEARCPKTDSVFAKACSSYFNERAHEATLRKR